MNRLYLWLQHHPCVVDSTIATSLGLLLLFVGAEQADPVASLLVYGALLVAIALRRKWFTAAFVLVIAAGLATVLVRNVWLGPAHLAVPILLYTAAANGPRWARRLGLLMIPVAPVLALWATDVYGRLHALGHPWPVLLAGLLAAPLAAAWVWGDSTRTKRLFYEELADRAHRLEREREALDRAIVAEERARIARELHDVIAHHVSVMVVQADGAAHALDSQPEQARDALRTISRTGREAMAEMRNLLGILRSDAVTDRAEHVPQPGLDAIEDLIGQFRAAGLPVGYTTAGRPRPTTGGVGLTAYRVIQEALTNALKHGGPGVTVSVRLGWSRDRLRIEVTDDGRGAPQSAAAAAGSGSGGHGIIGMRERVRSVGGTLRVGARPSGGYRVMATLPLCGSVRSARPWRRRPKPVSRVDAPEPAGAATGTNTA